MALSDELQRLAELHERGALSAEEFQRAKASLLNDPAVSHPAGGLSIQRLRRSAQDRWIAGVCGGLAKFFSVEPWVCRLGFALLLMVWGAGVPLYVLLWIFVPLDD